MEDGPTPCIMDPVKTNMKNAAGVCKQRGQSAACRAAAMKTSALCFSGTRIRSLMRLSLTV